MKLYLIQHGLSLSEEKDPEKPLSPEGTEQTQNTADFLKAKNINVDCLWHSPKLRAVQTAQIILKSVSCPDVQERNDLNPLDSVDKFPDEILSLNKSLMVVGHLPFLQKLVSLLITGSESYQCVSFKNSGVVCLEYSDAWNMTWMVIPELM